MNRKSMISFRFLSIVGCLLFSASFSDAFADLFEEGHYHDASQDLAKPTPAAALNSVDWGVPHQRRGPPGSFPKRYEPNIIENSYYITALAHFGCHEGFILTENKCVQEDVSDTLGSQLRCPMGWKYRRAATGETLCKGYETTAVNFECDLGFKQETDYNKKQYCIKRTSKPVLITCPDNYEADETSCVRRATQPSRLGCADGYVLKNNQCKGSIVLPLNTGCPEGFEMQGDDCVSVDRATAMVGCAGGFQFSSDTNSCKGFVKEIPLRTCPEGYDIFQKQCIAMNNVKPLIRCEPKLDFDGGNCTSSTLICPEKCSLKAGTCLCHSYANATNVCQENFTYNCLTDMCEQPISVAPQMVCPPDFTFANEECTRIRKMKKFHYCTNGIKQGKKCVFESFTKPSKLCKKGATKEQLPNGEFECVIESRVPWQMKICNEGFLSQSRCTHFETTPLRATCPVGFTNFGSICAKKVEKAPIIECNPQGSKGVTKQCSNKQFTEPIAICPDTFHYDTIAKNCYKLKRTYQLLNTIPSELLPQYLDFINFYKGKGTSDNHPQFDAINGFNITAANATAMLHINNPPSTSNSTVGNVLSLSDTKVLPTVPK